jgi:hypothetical protein
MPGHLTKIPQNVESDVDFDLRDVWGRNSSDIFAVGRTRPRTSMEGHETSAQPMGTHFLP